jgi:hypothetical protein
LILFLHNNSNVHILDELITNITALFSFEIWADSEITMFERINELKFFKIYQNLFYKFYVFIHSIKVIHYAKNK